MAVEEELYARSQAVSGLTDLIGTRFFQVEAPQGVTLPYCVFAPLGRDPVEAMQSSTGLVESRWEISCYAATADDARDLAVQVRAAFSRYSGTPSVLTIQDTFLEDEDAGFEPDTDRHFRDLNFVVWFEES